MQTIVSRATQILLGSKKKVTVVGLNLRKKGWENPVLIIQDQKLSRFKTVEIYKSEISPLSNKSQLIKTFSQFVYQVCPSVIGQIFSPSLFTVLMTYPNFIFCI